MFLLNSCLSLVSAARLRGRPFSRSYGTILPSSLTMLLPPALGSSPYPPVSVYGTGNTAAIAAFLGTGSSLFVTFFSLRLSAPGFPLPARALPMRPRSSVLYRCRNVHLLSIDYAFRPCLRSRLSQGRSASPWKPWISGREDSRLTLATHSGILSSCLSTGPYGFRFILTPMLLYHQSLTDPGLRRRV